VIVYKYILTYGSPIVLIIGVFWGIYYLKYISKPNYVILGYLIVSLIFDLVSRKIGSDSNNNLLLWPLLSLAELITFSIYYLKTNLYSRAIFLFLILGSIYMLTELYYIDVYNIQNFQPYSKVISSFIIVLFALIKFYQQIIKEDLDSLKKQYINSFILVYFSMNVLLLLPINYLINAKIEVTIYIWTVYLLITVAFYISLSYYLWKNGRKRKQLHCG
jgi:hypothetical protein